MRWTIIVALAALIICPAALASLDTTYAYNDGEFTWAGTTELYAARPADPSYFIDAMCEWCVDWLPGSVYGTDKFVYKYQLTMAEGSAELSQFGVGMLASNEANDISWNVLNVDDVEPWFAEILGGNSAYWVFDAVQPGQTTAQLTYTSVNMPLMFGSNITDASVVGYGEVPSPSAFIPEPMTLGLLAVGALMMLKKRR
jgi:hypothetical protein